MSELYSVPLKELVREFHMKVEYAATDFESIRLTVADLSRPGLQLAGYFNHFEPVRIQLKNYMRCHSRPHMNCRRSSDFLRILPGAAAV